MVMPGKKGYALKCEACGHEDAAFFRDEIVSLKELFLKIRGRKCPECGGKMKIDESQHIVF